MNAGKRRTQERRKNGVPEKRNAILSGHFLTFRGIKFKQCNFESF